MTTEEQLAEAIERIRQLEAALLTVGAFTAPTLGTGNHDQLMISVNKLDYERFNNGLGLIVTAAERVVAEQIFPRSPTQPDDPVTVYAREKLKLVKTRQNYATYTRTDEMHIGIAGVPAGVDLRGFVADEVRQEYDIANDRMAVSVRGHLPRRT